MKKVLAISSSAGLLGAARSFELLIQNINRTVWSPLVLCPSNGPLVSRLRQQNIPVEILSKDPEIHEHCLEGPSFRVSADLLRRMALRAMYVFRLEHYIRHMRNDLVYLNTIKNAASALAAKRAGKPVVWHVREVLIDFTGVRKLRLHILKLVADKVIVVSNSNKRMMEQLGVPTQKLVTIYNGVDTHSFVPVAHRDEELAARLQIRPHETIIGMIGEWTQRKGVVQFLQAAHVLRQQSPHLKFLLVGGTSVAEPTQTDAIHRLIEELQLHDALCLVGAQEDVRPYLGLMDIFVMPSLAEAFTRVNLEAMAMGKVVIATDVGGTREGLLEGQTGFIVPPNDPPAIAERIQILLNNPDLIQTMGQQGRARAEALFSSEHYAQQVQNIWHAVLDRTV